MAEDTVATVGIRKHGRVVIGQAVAAQALRPVDWRQAEIYVTPQDRTRLRLAAVGHAGEDGAFVLPVVDPGDYELFVLPQDRTGPMARPIGGSGPVPFTDEYDFYSTPDLALIGADGKLAARGGSVQAVRPPLEEWLPGRRPAPPAEHKPGSREHLPAPTPDAVSTETPASLVRPGGTGRSVIHEKTQRICIGELSFAATPLSEVIKQLRDEARKGDPDKRGVNFLITEQGNPAPPQDAEAMDPMTGLPAITVNPGIRDVTLKEALDAIVRGSARPIQYSVEDYAVVVAYQTAAVSPLSNRPFKVDPASLRRALDEIR